MHPTPDLARPAPPTIEAPAEFVHPTARGGRLKVLMDVQAVLSRSWRGTGRPSPSRRVKREQDRRNHDSGLTPREEASSICDVCQNSMSMIQMSLSLQTMMMMIRAGDTTAPPYVPS
jgi:hypothetical protein